MRPFVCVAFCGCCGVWLFCFGFCLLCGFVLVCFVLRIASLPPPSHKSCGVFLVLVEGHWTCALTYVLLRRVSLRLLNLDCRYPRDLLQPARKKNRQCTPVDVAKSCKTHKTRKVKDGIRNRARSGNTSKALPFCVTTAKSKGSCGGISSVDVVRKDQSSRVEQDIGEMAVASDPISETFSQPQILCSSGVRTRVS